MLALEYDEKLKWSEELASRLELQVAHQRPFSLIHHLGACDPPQGQFPWSAPSWICSSAELRHKNNNNTPGEAADADTPTAPDIKASNACTRAAGAVGRDTPTAKHDTSCRENLLRKHFLNFALEEEDYTKDILWWGEWNDFVAQTLMLMLSKFSSHFEWTS